jgi:hypothetical protein
VKAALLCLVLVACGASARQTTITHTVQVLDVAETAFLEFDGRHQLDLVNAATSLADGQAKLTSYRKDRDEVAKALIAAYRLAAVAATVDNDTSVSGLVQAAAIVAQELVTLGVKIP